MLGKLLDIILIQGERLTDFIASFDTTAVGSHSVTGDSLASPSPGPKHPSVATDLNNLAGLYHETGRLAEPLYQRAIAINEKVLPADHPYQALFRENYAALLGALGRTAEAAELRARAEAIRQRRG